VVSIMAGVLHGVISQRLLPRLGGGRIPAIEVLVSNARIAELIRERRTEEIPEAIAEGEFFEMQTFSKALISLVLGGLVEREVAADAASNRHDFLITLEHAEKAARVEQAQPDPEPETGPVEKPVPPEDDGLPALRIAGS
jgi:twitching motility protein PilT